MTTNIKFKNGAVVEVEERSLTNDNLRLVDYYKRVVKISQFILQETNSEPDKYSMRSTLEGTLKYGINPFYSVTEPNTLILEYCLGLPSRLHTPLGEFNIGNGGVLSAREGLQKEDEVRCSY